MTQCGQNRCRLIYEEKDAEKYFESSWSVSRLTKRFSLKLLLCFIIENT